MNATVNITKEVQNFSSYQMKMWIAYSIPRIEDGNNFGVSVQTDYHQAMEEIDEKQFLSMRLIVTELRNQYASLHYLIIKNFDKIVKPRSSNADQLY